MPDLLYADKLVLCGESQEDLRVMVGHFVEVCRRKGLKINASKRKVMVLGWDEGLEWEVGVDGIRLEHALEFKYFGCVLEESGKYEVECSRKVESGSRVADATRSLVNAKSLHLESVRVLLESLLVPVLTHGNETMIWKEKSRVRAVQVDNLRSLLGIIGMDKVPNARIREFCRVTKNVDERINEGVLR